ncbi:MAG: hypothetical protein WCJ70_00220 [bacterium]
MKSPHQKKITVGVIGAVVLLGIVALVMSRNQVAPAKNPVIAITQSPDRDVIPTAGPGVKVNLVSVDALKEIKLTVAGVPTGTSSIEYELTYSTKDQPSEGVFSTAKPKDGQTAFGSTFERAITLGTCSRNVCRYHAITSPIKVTLKFEGGYGAQIAQKDFELSSIE